MVSTENSDWLDGNLDLMGSRVSAEFVSDKRGMMDFCWSELGAMLVGRIRAAMRWMLSESVVDGLGFSEAVDVLLASEAIELVLSDAETEPPPDFSLFSRA